MPKNRPDLYRYVIDQARGPIDGQLTSAAARAIVLKVMNDRCVELLTQDPPHHPDVQLGLAILMTSMNASTPTNKTPVPYTSAFRSVIALLDNTAVPLQCRIIAAKGLSRMAKDAVVGVPDGDLTSVQRNEIAVALAKTLLASDSAGDDEGKQWFRSRIAEALGNCGLAFDLNGSSTPIDALMTVATNPQEALFVRAKALRAATQTAWNAQTNVPLITHEAMKLLVEVGKANNAAVAANTAATAAAAKAIADAKALDPNSAAAKAKVPPPSQLPAKLQHANNDIYLSFQPETSAQVALKWGLLNQVNRPGLNQNGPLVTAAYGLAMPVINHVMALEKRKVPVLIPNKTLEAVDTWLKANVPADRKVTGISPAPLPQ